MTEVEQICIDCKTAFQVQSDEASWRDRCPRCFVKSKPARRKPSYRPQSMDPDRQRSIELQHCQKVAVTLTSAIEELKGITSLVYIQLQELKKEFSE